MLFISATALNTGQTGVSVGFQSLTYRFGMIYNFLNLRLYDWKLKFATLAELVGQSENNEKPLKILDMACGTGYLIQYLHPSIDYEGWDLNSSFLKLIQKNRDKGKIKLRNFALKRRNIVDFENYPTERKDVIVLSDILHHVYPNHIKVLEHAKLAAKKVILCEPSAVKPQDIHAYDWTAKLTMGIAKRLPERLFKAVDFLFADNDGINSYEDRSAWKYNKKGLVQFFREQGMTKIYTLMDEVFGVWESS